MGSLLCPIREQRLEIIDSALRSLAVPSYEAIEEKLRDAGFSATKRTIQRDIKYMQAQYGAPDLICKRCAPDENDGNVEYGHYYSDPSWTLKIDAVTLRDIEAVKFASGLLKMYGTHPTSDDLNATYNKLVNLSEEAVVRTIDASLDPIAFAPVIQQAILPDVWRNIIQAAKERKSIRIEYDKDKAWSKDGQKSRLVDPYYVLNLGGAWYLIGTKGLTDPTPRQYAMDRIQKVTITKAHFEIPTDFDIDKILKVTFGRFIGDPNSLETVKVRFSNDVKPLVQGRIFHAMEKRHTDKQGRITVSFPVTPVGATPRWRYYHVRSWILSWGADCEVLAPDELKQLVREDLEKAAKQYL